jgi:putative tryptophan/tyrosine transport system substrate-binding protein
MTRIAALMLFLFGLTIVTPLSAGAQQGARAYRIGVLAVGPWNAIDGLHEGLKRLGYDEQKMRFEYRWAGRDERLPAAAAELVNLRVDFIITWGSPAALAAKGATSSIPIIGILGDPLLIGVTQSLARPGGNFTGFMTVSQELEAKRLELLREVVPGLASVAALWNPKNVSLGPAVQNLRAAASRFQLKIDFMEAANPEGLQAALDAIKTARPGALLIVADPFLITERKRIAAFAIANRLPSMSNYREYPETGGLMSYGPDYSDLFRRAGSYVDRIARGEKPGDLPFQQPSKFELGLNLKTASALGLVIPPAVRLRADYIVE